MDGKTKSLFLSGCTLCNASTVAGLTLATPLEQSNLKGLRSCPRSILLSAELTTESLKSECEVDGVLKQVPKIVPGATIKLNTALNRFKGVGSSIALLKRSDKRLSSLDQLADTISFQDEGEDVGIFRALIITLDRKGSKSSKEGIDVKVGVDSFSAGGEAAKAITGSWGALEEAKEEEEEEVVCMFCIMLALCGILLSVKLEA